MAKWSSMENRYTVVGNYRQPHKDSEGESLLDLTYDEAVEIESEWKRDKKYKEVFHFRQLKI